MKASLEMEAKEQLLPMDEAHYVDMSHLSKEYRDDPLLKQLPAELQQFVAIPEKTQLAYVKRSSFYEVIHLILSVLFLPYSLCKMIVVKQGQIALTQYGDEQEILGPGRHVLLSPWNRLIAVKNESDPIIHHGPIHIIRVEVGQLGYGVNMDSGRPILLPRGKHIIKSSTFVWKKFITLTERVTNLDQLDLVRIETGNIGYAYRHGNLVILNPGLHVISPPDRFGGIISTQLSILDLPLGVHDTSDYVPLAIKAAVFYCIVDPHKALTRIQNISQQILETSVATLAGIIRSSSLSDVASRSQPFYKSSIIEQDPNLPSAPPFFQHVHDEFIQQLHDHVKNEWGIEIQNIRIESLKINDTKLNQDISAQAIDVSKQHNKYIMLQKQQEIATVEANTKANQLRIETEAETNVVRAKAQAEADAAVIRAKAEKEAIRLRGEGEAEYSKLLESTTLGKDLALMKLQADALKGLKQIAYVPHLPGILNKGGVFADRNLILPNMDQNN